MLIIVGSSLTYIFSYLAMFTQENPTLKKNFFHRSPGNSKYVMKMRNVLIEFYLTST